MWSKEFSWKTIEFLKLVFEALKLKVQKVYVISAKIGFFNSHNKVRRLLNNCAKRVFEN